MLGNNRVIMAILILVFIAFMFGNIQASVVDGKTGVCMMGPGEYDSSRGIYYSFYGCTGTFASWQNFGTIAIANTPARFYSNTGITEDQCVLYGGLWEYGSECYLPPDSFQRAGLENIYISEFSGTMSAYYNGWEPFYEIQHFEMKNTGLWTGFPAWDNIDEDFLAMHPHPDSDNHICSISGGIWVKPELGPVEYCGDNICQDYETCGDCPEDCGQCAPVCGNNICEQGENQDNCPNDCGVPGTDKWCGDNVCSPEIGENQNSCPSDCGEPSQPTNMFEWIIQSIQNFISWLMSLIGI